MTHENKIGFSTNIFDNPENIFPVLNNLCENFSTVEIELENGLKNIFNYDTEKKNDFFRNILDIKEKKNLNFTVHAPYLGPSTDISSHG